jgi:uncharacterized protein
MCMVGGLNESMASMKRKLKWLTCAVVVGAATALPAAQPASPSFDCAKASGEVEELICKDAGLAALDRKLAGVYENASKNWPADIASGQKVLQRGWIKGRNDCWKAEDKRDCVEYSYRTRIVELQIQSGQLEAPTPVGYVCKGEEGKPFFAAFYQQTDPAIAVVTFGDDQVILFLEPAGSGAKYVAPNVELWEHHGEAKVDWYGTELQCKAR